MLPSPTCTFTIPSIHDDTVLDCRLYTPATLFTASDGSSRPWRKKAAIVAHPYAPLGGSMDDPVVDMVAFTILKQGFVVGTFNFRGAGGSKGRTSWTAKAETKDYISFIGFMIYFMHHLSPHNLLLDAPPMKNCAAPYDLSPIPSHSLPAQSPPSHTSRSRSSINRADAQASAFPEFDTGMSMGEVLDETDSKPVLLLAGYSYGALMTTLLPSLQLVLNLFHAPEVGTAASEIRLRASRLAKEQTEIFAKLAKTLQHQSIFSPIVSHRKGHSLPGREPSNPLIAGGLATVRIGGEETNPDFRRISHESHSRRSLSYDTPERLRRSVDKVRTLGRRQSSHIPLPKRQISVGSTSSKPEILQWSDDTAGPDNTIGVDLDVHEASALDLGPMKAAYLLVSPPQGLVHSLVTLWTLPRTKIKPQAGNISTMAEEEAKLVLNETLAIYGDGDIFTSSKKLGNWADRLQSVQGSRFSSVEVEGAGHFWHEPGVAARMRGHIGGFLEHL
ncbi:MAG: hypothetical protein M1818_007450 [Claussenomyces sp. TS43310]|nr:MAG: hypothetical protein M1818_007450 [Claussenomyces sp. TS43310]